jgi:hypothetical protein
MPSVADVKAKVVGFVLTLVMLIIVLNLTPVFITSATLDTGGWTFTGHVAAATLIGLLPLIVVIVIFVAIAVSLFEDLI